MFEFIIGVALGVLIGGVVYHFYGPKIYAKLNPK